MRHLFLSLFLSALGFASAQGQALQLHPQNGHYFLYRNKPLVLVGSGEHYGAVINPDFDFDTYLRTIAADGLNTTRLFTGAYIEKLGDFGIQKNTLAPAEGRLLLPWRRSALPGYALGGNKFDLNQWDEAYFTRLKNFLSKAEQHGIVVEVNFFSSHYGGGWQYSALNRNNNINGTDSVASSVVNTLHNGNILRHQERYVRKLVRELNAFDNIYFEIQNEPWADQTDTVLVRNEYGDGTDWRNTIQVVSQKSNAWQRQVARWIQEEEKSLPRKHLISQNISNFYYPVENPDPLISIFNFHYALPVAVTQNYSLNKVIGLNETGFAGKSDQTYRRQAWRFLMAGGGLFNHLDYSFWPGSESGNDTAYNAPGGGSPALRRQLGILKRFFDGLDLVRLRPDTSVLVAAPGAWAQVLGNNSSQWIVYYEQMAMKPAPLQVRLPRGSYKVQWMDVESGKLLPAGEYSNGPLNVPESAGDRVALITRL